jgi:predicted nucleic acid-binding protein
MSDKREILVKDACIIIDLIELGLLSACFDLPCILVTTTQVIDEIINLEQRAIIQVFINDGKLIIDGSGDLLTILKIKQNNSGLSFTDCTVLELAIRQKAILLSADKSLRNESKRQGLEVKGILWIIEQLYGNELIEKGIFLEKLKIYPEINKRAPLNEIKDLISRFT